MRWLSEPPVACDLCHKSITGTFVDGATRPTGIWGFMCPSCFATDGYGLGTGVGQKYELQPDGVWLKTGG
jgi:hypothetical protein